MVAQVSGDTVQLGKPLQNSYVTSDNNTAQIVRAFEAEILDVTGDLYLSDSLNGNSDTGGVMYIRAREVIVRNGGQIRNNYGYLYGNGCSSQGEGCQVGRGSASLGTTYSINANSTGGGGGC